MAITHDQSFRSRSGRSLVAMLEDSVKILLWKFFQSIRKKYYIGGKKSSADIDEIQKINWSNTFH